MFHGRWCRVVYLGRKVFVPRRLLGRFRRGDEGLRLLCPENLLRGGAFQLLKQSCEIGIMVDSCSGPLQMRAGIQRPPLVYQQFSERQMRKRIFRYDLDHSFEKLRREGWMPESPICLREI